MPESGYMGFVGVTTESSSIMRIFPAWAEELGLPTRRIVGHDVALNAPASVYRELVCAIRDDARHYGALVTTHKMNVYESCHDLFGLIDPLATLFGEVSSIAKRGPTLTGAAKDPITVRLADDDTGKPARKPLATFAAPMASNSPVASTRSSRRAAKARPVRITSL